jgi:hypothetical protein
MARFLVQIADMNGGAVLDLDLWATWDRRYQLEKGLPC